MKKKRPAHVVGWPPTPGGCIEWQGAKNHNGYGHAWDYSEKKTVRAHRLAWEARYGPIPKGTFVLHTCDNRACINVQHLYLGTAADNTKDMIGRGRQVSRKKTHCLRGHPFDEENTYTWKGKRNCRACQRERRKRR